MNGIASLTLPVNVTIIQFGIENYLKTTPYKLLKFMIKFRTRNHRLPIETGSWTGLDVYVQHSHDEI